MCSVSVGYPSSTTRRKLIQLKLLSLKLNLCFLFCILWCTSIFFFSSTLYIFVLVQGKNIQFARRNKSTNNNNDANKWRRKNKINEKGKSHHKMASWMNCCRNNTEYTHNICIIYTEKYIRNTNMMRKRVK